MGKRINPSVPPSPPGSNIPLSSQAKAQIEMLIRDGQRYLDGDALAAWYGVSRATIAWWRHTGYGPLGVRCGRYVRYPIENVVAFDEELRAKAEAER